MPDSPELAKARKFKTLMLICGSMGLIVTIIIVTFVIDMWIAASWGTEYTISWLTLDMSHKYPAIPFMFGSSVFGFLGFLCGHLFGSQLADNDVVVYKE